MKDMQTELVVIGCGMAGTMAAVAAARLGRKVIALEEMAFPGGSMTAMGTGPMMTFHAGEQQVIRGLAQEMVDRLIKGEFSPGHTVDSTGYTYTVTPFSAEGMKLVLEQMLLEAGVTVLYHTAVTGVTVLNGRAAEISCYACGQSFRIQARLMIDATGDADALVQAGVPCVTGRPQDGKNQPMTMNYRVSGVDIAAIRRHMAEHPELFPFLAPKAGIERNAVRLSFSGFQDIMREGIRSGELTVDRDIVLCFENDHPGEVIVNMSRVLGEDPLDPLSLSRAEAEGRRQVQVLFRFMKKHIPGFENTLLLTSGPNIGIRSSRRMVGVYTLTAEDILSCQAFSDAVACFGYPIDIHSADGVETDSRFLQEGAYYTIPYRCLINTAVPNMMAAGRNISCTYEAQASTRLSPCCAAIGQAAGTAAAIALESGLLPTGIDPDALRRQLLADNAFLTPYAGA